MIARATTRWLRHPLTRGVDLDDPRTIELHRRVIESKPFLSQIYEEWYRAISRSLPVGSEPVLEVGSGPGFLARFIPELITSEIMTSRHVGLVLDATRLPLADGSLRAIVMTNVFHHLAEPRQFLQEAARCIRPEGAIVMIEPWVSPWSRVIYRRFHHEPFDPAAVAWEMPRRGPLSGANGALPWIVFARDRPTFEREFPEWEVRRIVPSMPFTYLLSGGLSFRTLMPAWSYPLWHRLEQAMDSRMSRWAMYAQITLVKRGRP